MSTQQEIFLAFCDATKKGATTATDKTLKKICQDCKLYTKKVDNNRIDIQFRKHIGNQRKDIDFNGFMQFIEGAWSDAYVESKEMSKQEAVQFIKDKLMQTGPKLTGATQVSKDDATARLTDAKGYTGAHKERFDADGKGKGIEGREDLHENDGYVDGYKLKGTYDQKH